MTKKVDWRSATTSDGRPTVYSLRRALGMKARRPNQFALCVGRELEGKTYPDPLLGKGGRLDPRIRQAFKDAVSKCSPTAQRLRRDVAKMQTRYMEEGTRGG